MGHQRRKRASRAARPPGCTDHVLTPKQAGASPGLAAHLCAGNAGVPLPVYRRSGMRHRRARQRSTTARLQPVAQLTAQVLADDVSPPLLRVLQALHDQHACEHRQGKKHGGVVGRCHGVAMRLPGRLPVTLLSPCPGYCCCAGCKLPAHGHRPLQCRSSKAPWLERPCQYRAPLTRALAHHEAVAALVPRPRRALRLVVPLAERSAGQKGKGGGGAAQGEAKGRANAEPAHLEARGLGSKTCGAAKWPASMARPLRKERRGSPRDKGCSGPRALRQGCDPPSTVEMSYGPHTCLQLTEVPGSQDLRVVKRFTRQRPVHVAPNQPASKSSGSRAGGRTCRPQSRPGPRG